MRFMKKWTVCCACPPTLFRFTLKTFTNECAKSLMQTKICSTWTWVFPLFRCCDVLGARMVGLAYAPCRMCVRDLRCGSPTSSSYLSTYLGRETWGDYVLRIVLFVSSTPYEGLRFDSFVRLFVPVLTVQEWFSDALFRARARVRHVCFMCHCRILCYHKSQANNVIEHKVFFHRLISNNVRSGGCARFRSRP